MAIKTERIHVIINPAAGADAPVLNLLNRVFSEHDVHWTVSVTLGKGDARRQAQDAIEAGVDVVAAYGGDGTLMEVVGGMVGSGMPLAFLPGGTGNVMAAELHVPRRVERAAELIFQPDATLRKLDVGRIGEYHFVMRASVGFEAKVIEKTSREMKDRFGLLAYGISAFQALAEPLTAKYRLTLDGKVVETEGASLLIANAGSIGRLNLTLGQTVEPDDGLLDVIVIANDPNSVLSMAASVIQIDGLKASLQHWQARTVGVEAHPPQNVQVDGDLLGQTPIEARVLPEAVSVIVPGAT